MSEDLSGFNPDERILCPDDTCIGLVGPDGRCKICKTPYTGDLPDTLTGDTEDLPSPADTPEAVSEPSAADEESEAVDAEDRQMCPDETCIGIIGPDGVCGTCGRRATDIKETVPESR